jgi:hypothetical protein
MYNDNIKKSIYKWRENNKDEWKDYHNVKEKERYEKNKIIVLAKMKEKYDYNKFLNNRNLRIELEYFRNILI